MTSALVLALLLAQQPAPPEKCTLSGTVVDSITRQPLDKVRVVAEHRGHREPDASTTTDAKGEFQLVDVDPGEYHLSLKRSGYLQTYYGAKRDSDNSGSPITLTAGQVVENLHAKLIPFGVIAGTVRDSDGEPLAGTSIELFATAYRNGLRTIRDWNTSTTDDLGQFRIAGLPPGRYYISASFGRHGEDGPTVDHSARGAPRPDPPMTTFYPGTVDPSSAQAIEIQPGGHQTGVDITVIRRPLYKVIAHLHASPEMRTYARLLYAAEGFGTVGHDSNIDKETIEITGVPVGSYILRFGASVPEKSVAGVINLNESSGCESSMPVSIDKNDTQEITAAFSACATVTGHIVTDTGKPLKDAGGWGNTFDLDHLDDNHHFLKNDGSFQMDVSAGHHTLDFDDITRGNNLYVKSIRAGNQDLLRTGLNVSSGDHLDLEVLLASDGGALQGTVSDADSKPVPGARVVLIPNDPTLRTRSDYTLTATTTPTGNYKIKAIAPGDYKLFAWDDIEKDSWFDPDVMKNFEARGTSVSIKATDPDVKDTPAQTADLQVIQ